MYYIYVKIIINFLALVYAYQNFWLHVTIYNAPSDWPHTFLQPGCFYLAYNIITYVCHLYAVYTYNKIRDIVLCT